MSLETGYSPAMNDAVQAAIANGVTFVVAAGNDGGNACSYSPGAVPDAVTVGATNSADERVAWSNFGSCVDLFAPGEGIATIWNSTNTTVTYASGTSFSSPMVAGIAALYLDSNPTATPGQVQDAIKGAATQGLVSGAGDASPNALAYSLISAGTPSCGGTLYSGSIQRSGDSDYQSSRQGFGGLMGIYSGTIQVSGSAAMTLTLELKQKNRWIEAASSGGGQTVLFEGRRGTYRWRISSVSGTGNYSLCSYVPQ
jgi:subtilisin family serine protease